MIDGQWLGENGKESAAQLPHHAKIFSVSPQYQRMSDNLKIAKGCIERNTEYQIRSYEMSNQSAAIKENKCQPQGNTKTYIW